jgi:hypothetical protein
MMSVSLSSSLEGDSGTFPIAAWNIRCAQGAGLAAAARGLRRMGVSCCILTKTKLTDNRYPKTVLGYLVIASKVTSPRQGGIAILWEADHLDFEVKAAQVLSLNLLTFQLVTAETWFFVMGAYIPPASTATVAEW